MVATCAKHKRAQPSGSRCPGGSSQRQIVTHAAAPRFGQPRADQPLRRRWPATSGPCVPHSVVAEYEDRLRRCGGRQRALDGAERFGPLLQRAERTRWLGQGGDSLRRAQHHVDACHEVAGRHLRFFQRALCSTSAPTFVTEVRELDTHPSHVLVRHHHGTKMSSIEQLEAASAEQGATVAALKKQKADKPAVDAAVAELLQKKAALKAALDAALVAAKASGDAAAVAVLEEKIVAVTPRPPTHKQPKKDTAPKGGGGEKPAAAAPPAKKAAPAKPAATPAAKQPAATAAAPAAPAASPSLAALVNVAALDAHMESRSFVAGGPSATQADGRARASAPALDLDLAPVFLSLSFSLSLARSLPPRPPPFPWPWPTARP